MQLSTEVKNESVIIFHDKGEKWITEKQADYVLEQSCQPNAKGIKLDGSFYTFSSMAKILSEKDYYEQYPDKRPETKNVFEEFYGNTRDYTPMERTAEQSKNQFSGLLKGLKSFIDGELKRGITPKYAIEIYEEKLERYKQKFAN